MILELNDGKILNDLSLQYFTIIIVRLEKQTYRLQYQFFRSQSYHNTFSKY